MARVASRKTTFRKCVRRTMKTLHKKAKTTRQHQLVVGKAAKKCAAGKQKRCARGSRRVLRKGRRVCVKSVGSRRRTYTRKQKVAGLEPSSVEVPPFVTPDVNEYETEFQNTPCDKSELSRTKRRLAKKVLDEVGSAKYPDDPRAKEINSAEARRTDECIEAGAL